MSVLLLEVRVCVHQWASIRVQVTQCGGECASNRVELYNPCVIIT